MYAYWPVLIWDHHPSSSARQSIEYLKETESKTHATQNLTDDPKWRYVVLKNVSWSCTSTWSVDSSPLAGGALRCTQTACSDTASGLKTHCTPPRCRFLHKFNSGMIGMVLHHCKIVQDSLTLLQVSHDKKKCTIPYHPIVLVLNYFYYMGSNTL